MSNQANEADSRFQENDDVEVQFEPDELSKLRFLLRKLRFMEQKSKGNQFAPNVHAEFEMESIAWLMTDCGYLKDEP